MTFFEIWKSYRQRVLPPTAPEVQVIETRRAFYAGAWAILNHLSDLMSAGEDVTDEDLDFVQRFHDELKQFGASGGQL